MDMLPKPASGRLPLIVTGGSQQSPVWIAGHGDGWMLYPRALETQARILDDWRARTRALGRDVRPAMQPLYIDLSPDPDAAPEAIHLGLRVGVRALRHYLETLEAIGVNHVALNLRFNRADIDDTLYRLADDILPAFSPKERHDREDHSHDGIDRRHRPGHGREARPTGPPGADPRPDPREASSHAGASVRRDGTPERGGLRGGSLPPGGRRGPGSGGRESTRKARCPDQQRRGLPGSRSPHGRWARCALRRQHHRPLPADPTAAAADGSGRESDQPLLRRPGPGGHRRPRRPETAGDGWTMPSPPTLRASWPSPCGRATWP